MAVVLMYNNFFLEGICFFDKITKEEFCNIIRDASEKGELFIQGIAVYHIAINLVETHVGGKIIAQDIREPEPDDTVAWLEVVLEPSLHLEFYSGKITSKRSKTHVTIKIPMTLERKEAYSERPPYITLNQALQHSKEDAVFMVQKFPIGMLKFPKK